MSTDAGRQMFGRVHGQSDELPSTRTKVQRSKLARLADLGDRSAAEALRQYRETQQQQRQDEINQRTGGHAAYDE